MTSFFLLLTILASPSGGADKGADLVILEQYRWQNRLIIVFAPTSDDSRFREQQASFDKVRKAEMAERDLLVFSCFASGGTLEAYAQEPERQTFGTGAADALRDTFGVAVDDFQIVLVGKDGGEKRRSSVPVAIEDLMGQIDSMPMRQQEMRK